LGVSVSQKVATAIYRGTKLAKLSIVSVRRGYWEGIRHENVNPYTVPRKLTGQYGSVEIHLRPAPPGVGIVAPPVFKELLQMAGYEDCYMSIRGNTGSTGEIVKALGIAIQA
jgi:small subunit ribosomal protein S2e